MLGNRAADAAAEPVTMATLFSSPNGDGMTLSPCSRRMMHATWRATTVCVSRAESRPWLSLGLSQRIRAGTRSIWRHIGNVGGENEKTTKGWSFMADS